jgi:hypothetical protein
MLCLLLPVHHTQCAALEEQHARYVSQTTAMLSRLQAQMQQLVQQSLSSTPLLPSHSMPHPAAPARLRSGEASLSDRLAPLSAQKHAALGWPHPLNQAPPPPPQQQQQQQQHVAHLRDPLEDEGGVVLPSYSEMRRSTSSAPSAPVAAAAGSSAATPLKWLPQRPAARLPQPNAARVPAVFTNAIAPSGGTSAGTVAGQTQAASVLEAGWQPGSGPVRAVASRYHSPSHARSGCDTRGGVLGDLLRQQAVHPAQAAQTMSFLLRTQRR